MAATAIDNEAELSIALESEIRKVRNQIRDVSDELDNSQLGLGISVRLGVQRRELEAYLRGILFALGEEPA